MDLKFFYDNYKFEELNVKKLYIENNELHLLFSMDVKLELIANGYRPEMDVEYDNEFIFEVNHDNKKFKNNELVNIEYNGGLIFKFKNEDIIIFNNNVIVK
ncbi:MAG: hypothetical protein IKP77_06135 [Acholeplasmatales bacterium]|nr:hypothetical protein [Acholeplasmatales bacterium]